jgi:hypothetical protein
MREILRNNGLSLALFALFLASIVGQVFFGWRALGEELAIHGHLAPDLRNYLLSGHFLSATFENWESEFLQMGVYVLLTAWLIQKGSPESRAPGESWDEPCCSGPGVPWPVRKGGLWLRLYAHSLSITLFVLFALSFWLHLLGSTRRANEEALLHAAPAITAAQRLADPEFWYESFQNWQSEFLSIGTLIVLAIFLRERGSPESKPVQAPHSQTGG